MRFEGSLEQEKGTPLEPATCEDCDYQPAKQIRDCRENLPGPIPLVPLVPSFRQLNVPVS